MAFKNFHGNTKSLIKTKAILNEINYNKYYVRNTLKVEKQLQQIDLNGNVTNAKSISVNQGQSAKINKIEKIKQIINQRGLIETNRSNFLITIEKKLTQIESVNKQILFLKTIKGGARVSYSGFLGFTPLSQLKIFAKRLVKSIFLIRLKKRIPNLIFLLDSINKNSKFHVFRAPFNNETLKLYPYARKNRRKQHANKLNCYRNRINFVYTFGRPRKKFFKSTKKKMP